MALGRDIIFVPLHSYSEDFSVPQDMSELQVSLTSRTIRITKYSTDRLYFMVFIQIYQK